jgi:hypothetical protein
VSKKGRRQRRANPQMQMRATVEAIAEGREPEESPAEVAKGHAEQAYETLKEAEPTGHLTSEQYNALSGAMQQDFVVADEAARAYGESWFKAVLPELGEGQICVVIDGEVGEVITRLLLGEYVPSAKRRETNEAWRAALQKEDERIRANLDALDLMTDWRRRQLGRLHQEMEDALLGISLLQPGVQDGGIKASHFRAPDLAGAVEAVRRYFTPDDAQAILKEAWESIPEEGAYEAEYIEAIRKAVIKTGDDQARKAVAGIADREGAEEPIEEAYLRGMAMGNLRKGD